MNRTAPFAVAFIAFAAMGANAQAIDDNAATALMTKAACNACHQVDKKAVGPAYKDVAAKYKGNAKALELLTEKVRKGGMGNWGAIPMPPNPKEKIGDEDLKKLLTWILLRT